MYASNLNETVATGKEGINRAKKMITDAIANKRCSAIMATANDGPQRDVLRALGFKRMRVYYSHDHQREVFCYIRETSREEYSERKGIFKKS
jgi:hypothetical protein